VAEAAAAASAGGKIIDDRQFHLYHRHHDELRDALTELFKLRLDQLEGLDPVLTKLAAASA